MRSLTEPSQTPDNSRSIPSLVPRVGADPAKLADCAHCPELERLIRHLAGIERHLEVVTRALMGQMR